MSAACIAEASSNSHQTPCFDLYGTTASPRILLPRQSGRLPHQSVQGSVLLQGSVISWYHLCEGSKNLTEIWCTADRAAAVLLDGVAHAARSQKAPAGPQSSQTPVQGQVPVPASATPASQPG